METVIQFIQNWKKRRINRTQRNKKCPEILKRFQAKIEHTDAEYLELFQDYLHLSEKESKEMLVLINEIAEVRAEYFKIRRRVMKKNHPELYEKLKKKKMLHLLLM